jgi:hypothetical protein
MMYVCISLLAFMIISIYVKNAPVIEDDTE